jgi:hypothetical protein
MTTNRTPIQRPALTMISARAVDLYVAMGKLRCTCPVPKPPTVGPCPGCAAWYDLHAELHDELRCELWEWPCVARQPKRAGSAYMNESIGARMAMLKEAAKARRTVSPSSEKEESPDVEPVADPRTHA